MWSSRKAQQLEGMGAGGAVACCRRGRKRVKQRPAMPWRWVGWSTLTVASQSAMTGADACRVCRMQMALGERLIARAALAGSREAGREQDQQIAVLWTAEADMKLEEAEAVWQAFCASLAYQAAAVLSSLPLCYPLQAVRDAEDACQAAAAAEEAASAARHARRHRASSPPAPKVCARCTDL